MFDIQYSFHWHQAFAALPDMLKGCEVSLKLAVLSMAMGVPIALTLAAVRQARTPAFAAIASAWVSVARNTPALLQVYFLYFGFGAFGIHVSSWAALLGGIAFNNAGYLAENFRGGFNAIPEAQMKAARSLGLSERQAYLHVIFPQLLRIVFPPITNQMIWALLMTSLGVAVGLNSDLTGVTQEYNVRTFRTFEFFSIAAVLYYVMAKLLLLGTRLASWRLFRY